MLDRTELQKIYAETGSESEEENSAEAAEPVTEFGVDHQWSKASLPGSDSLPPSYPLDKLPDAMREFVEQIAESTQTPTDMCLVACISTLSACVAGKANVAYNDYTEPLQIWAATIAESGTGKSPVYRYLSKPIEDWEVAEAKSTKTARAILRSERASLEKRLKGLEQVASGQKILFGSKAWDKVIQDQTTIRERLEDFPSVSKPRIISQDITPEALVLVMRDNHERQAVLSAEAEALQIISGRYTNRVNADLWKKGYDSDTFNSDRIRDKSSIQLVRPALAVSLMFQPVVMKTLRNQNVLQGEGLLGRFLYAVPRSNVGFRKTGPDVAPADPMVVAEYGRRATILLNASFPATDVSLPTLTFTPAALQVLYDLQAKLEVELRPDGLLYSIRDWGSKSFGRTLRIAGVLHIFEEASGGEVKLDATGPIDEDMVLAAADIVRASIPHALAAYAMFGRDKKAQTLEYVYNKYLELLESALPVTKRDLHQATKNKSLLGGQISELEPYISEMENRNLLRQIEKTDGGRPTVVLVPNPEITGDTNMEGQISMSNSPDGDEVNPPFETFETQNESSELNDLDFYASTFETFESLTEEESTE